jgi:hypothetical protein
MRRATPMVTLSIPALANQFLSLGQYDIGHKYGEEWWRTQQTANEEGWTRQQVIEYENQPSRFQIEDPASNRSHVYEMPK